MIRNFQISNFKSLVGFKIRLPKFTVLVGMNGAGKSTILQSFDFASQLMVGKVDEWLANRGWSSADLGSKLVPESTIICAISLKKEPSLPINLLWMGLLNRKELACLYEDANLVFVENDEVKFRDILNVKSRHYKIGDGENKDISFTYQGSILSQLRESELTPELLEIRDSLRKVRSLELLAPHLMRQRARGSAADIGYGGEQLSSYLASIKGDAKVNLIKNLKIFYPQLVDIKASPIKGGWKRLTIVEEFDGRHVETEARHVNDGLLRILAILSQSITGHEILLFDEIENGVNPQIIEKLVDTLVASEQQIIVTTHNPMILNYLEDSIAREAVQFVYKNPAGITRVRPFFSIERIRKKLDVMGPGEAFIDTDLVALTNECVALDLKEDDSQMGIIQSAKSRKQVKASDVVKEE